jgi:hypothetical protein
MALSSIMGRPVDWVAAPSGGPVGRSIIVLSRGILRHRVLLSGDAVALRRQSREEETSWHRREQRPADARMCKLMAYGRRCSCDPGAERRGASWTMAASMVGICCDRGTRTIRIVLSAWREWWMGGWWMVGEERRRRGGGVEVFRQQLVLPKFPYRRGRLSGSGVSIR